MALIKLVDAAQHVGQSSPSSSGSTNWAMLRAEVAIRHILALWKMRNSH